MDAEQIIHFRDLALLELKRAERYRNFLSLLVLNLSEFLTSAGRRKINSDEETEVFLRNLIDRIKNSARETDMISNLGDSRLVMLLPETDSEGAQVAGERMRELLSEFLAEFLDSDYHFEVPVEVASFPESKIEERSFKSRLMDLLSIH